jgi:ABC-type lipoprotein export system ATPase subunit
VSDPLLSLRGASVSYWRGSREVRVLRDVSLDLDAGRLLAVWGQHRSGKTTLLKLAAGLVRPDSGVVRFDGRDLQSLSASALAGVLREQIAWARPSGPQTPDLRILDYVALPLLGDLSRREAHRRAAGALERVGASQCSRAVWAHLSDSEQTLVVIAHAIVREPRLLLLDEQTASLDDLERERVMALLRAATDEAGMAVLITVPDMPEMLHAHELRTLSGGRLLSPSEDPELDTHDPLPGNVIDFPAERSA